MGKPNSMATTSLMVYSLLIKGRLHKIQEASAYYSGADVESGKRHDYSTLLGNLLDNAS